uniref:50S ribosomal protein L32, chloroplastic n=1 Tax=Lotharella globosa TaxID=91324 RepID=A0A7S4DWW1_9EUKA|mmetsp:Transcript_21763/g.43687  ORF Transcript_21763/g.43687 Transcript_21763/m.43687 type:complete len:128 (-) Transcript_21763:188-571(-)|eukprot:CAMPEP_0167794748 /NCGR_PEP_ID=MMETSP0111_2-20121227/13987_1 /TAXON_ID=91324 /ORGANISM="Lotharella globosa, Strain CCCM811" /LENGTH=127 /DNA_ID=CAMNT_0007688209 /DNA_START=1 /DNA_END=384 /DNA_ORIENTATION=-
MAFVVREKGAMYASLALNFALMALLAIVCWRSGQTSNLELGLSRAAQFQPSFRAVAARPTVRTNIVPVMPVAPLMDRDISCDAVPKKRHSKQKKRHRKMLWKKAAFKQADKALAIARKIRNQDADDE